VRAEHGWLVADAESKLGGYLGAMLAAVESRRIERIAREIQFPLPSPVVAYWPIRHCSLRCAMRRNPSTR
jgi:hypothetical protein